jgi:hypothetical protein
MNASVDAKDLLEPSQEKTKDERQRQGQRQTKPKINKDKTQLGSEINKKDKEATR